MEIGFLYANEAVKHTDWRVILSIQHLLGFIHQPGASIQLKHGWVTIRIHSALDKHTKKRGLNTNQNPNEKLSSQVYTSYAIFRAKAFKVHQ